MMALRGLKVIELAGLAPSPFAGMVLAGKSVNTPAICSSLIMWLQSGYVEIVSPLSQPRFWSLGDTSRQTKPTSHGHTCKVGTDFHSLTMNLSWRHYFQTEDFVLMVLFVL